MGGMIGAGAKRVCIVTPGQIGSNPRVVKEAQALHDAGYTVQVIATQVLPFVEPRDQSIIRAINWNLTRIDLRSRPRWRLLRGAQVASRLAWQATGHGACADMGFSAFTPALTAAVRRTDADLYIAHYPAALPLVAAAARRAGALYAYDAEDYHPGDWPPDPVHDTDRRLLNAIEGRYLPGCAYVTAASPGIAEAYACAYPGLRPYVVLNTFPRAQAPAAASPQGTAEPGPSLYWFSQTIGPHRGLECAVRAIGLAQSRPHLYLRGSLGEDFLATLQNVAISAGVSERIHILKPEDPDRMEQLASSYDLGLVGEHGYSESRQLCLTNKLFSFLLSGLPPLLSDTPAHRAFAVEAGLEDLVFPAEDAGALATRLDDLLGDPERLAALRHSVYRLGQERYCWDEERKALLGLVGQVIRPARRKAA